MVSIEDLQSAFLYDPETGQLTRAKSHAAFKAGTIAGSVDWDRGHRLKRLVVSCKKKSFSAHRVVWALMTGEWPTMAIDHIDGDPTNNRWANLRLATSSQNSANRRSLKKSGVKWKGVCYVGTPIGRPYRATIKVNRNNIVLGNFRCPTAGHFAYRRAARKFFGEYARFA